MNISLIVFILTAINFAFQVDFVVLMPLGPTLMQRFSLSPKEFSLLVSVYTLTAGITSIIFSLFGNYFRKKNSLVWAIFLLGIASFITGKSNSFEQLFFVRFLAGCFSGILNPLIFAIASDTIPVSSRGKAMGWIMSGFSLASVFGVPVGLYLNDEFGHEMTFSTISCVFFVILILALFILPRDKELIKKLNKEDLIKNFRECLNNLFYLKGYFLLFFISGAIFIVIPLLSPFAVNNMGVDITDLKHMYFFGGVLTVLTSRIIGMFCDKFSAKKVLTGVSILSIFPVLIFTFSGVTPVFQFIVIGSLMMSLMSGMMVPSMTISTLIPNKNDYNTFNGILNSMRGFGSSIFAFLSGMILTVSASTNAFLDFEKIGLIYILLIGISLIINFLIVLDKK